MLQLARGHFLSYDQLMLQLARGHFLSYDQLMLQLVKGHFLRKLFLETEPSKRVHVSHCDISLPKTPLFCET